MKQITRRALLIGTPALLVGCRKRASPGALTVYTSLDEPYARPVLQAFSRETGLEVRPVYDTEANKSRGLAQRIQAERERPQADVFWSSEVLQTLGLREEGVLEPYRSPSAEGIPERYRDPDGYWTGFAARFRVLVHRPGLKDPPKSLLDLTAPRWRKEVAMAQPLFGTTTTEVAALFQVLGDTRARDYYRRRKVNETLLVDGNSVAAELVARGDVLVGQTDTDDAFSRQDAGKKLEVVYPDQDGIGSLLIPNTAALVRGGPKLEAGRRFLDYLLRAETELLLAGLPSRQLPLHSGLTLPERVRPLAAVKPMRVDYRRLPEQRSAVDRFLREVFLA
jgi:iron(III) transport system substrate-binding protein